MSIIPIILIPQIIFAGVIASIDTKDKELISYTMLGRWGTEGLARIQNDYATFYYTPSVNSGKEGTTTQQETSIGSVYAKVKDPVTNKYILTKADPLKQLGYYENSKLINAFDSFEKNILAITLLNLFMFYMLVRFLKRKDKIKITT